MPIGGASIEAKGTEGTAGSAASGSDGEWGPIGLPAGTYDITVTKDGYDPGDYPGIVVIDDTPTSLLFTLHPADYS